MISLILAVVSFAIQMMQARNARARAKKAQKEADERADAAKGLAVTTEMTPIPLRLVYGRFKAGGVRCWHEVSNNSDNASVVSGGVQLNTFNVNISGSKNEFLKFQQAICIGGFSNCYGADIDGVPAGTFGGYYNIHVYPTGGIVDNQGAPTTHHFNDIGYLGASFKINRDDPQFNGVPEVTIYGDGKPVPAVIWTGTDWAVSSSTSYSNNPARVLLDYLLSPFGRNLTADDIDLASFVKAQAICDKVMIPSVDRAGRYWTERGGTRVINRFECNTSLGTDDGIRDNIEKILESMDMAELIWSGGKYKLQLWYPVEFVYGATYYRDDVVQTLDEGYYNLYIALETTNSDPHVNVTSWAKACNAYVTDDMIQREREITISWPNAQARFNSVSIRYLNESKDFVEDTAVWPRSDSELHSTFLTADGGVELVGDFFESTITDSWHATARAEQRCRQSRIAAIYKFSVGPALSLLEPGDIIRIDSDVLNVHGQLAMISAVKVQKDGSLDLEAVRYDARTLAWNANDEENILLPTDQNLNIPQVTNLTFDTLHPTFSNTVGTLRWDAPDDNRVTKYLIKGTDVYRHNIQSNTVWFDIGTTTATWFDIPSLKSASYTFAVVAATSNGKLAPKYDVFTDSHWPTVAAGLAIVAIDGVTYASVNIYTRAASAPATPTGGEFNFSTAALSITPIGWYASTPSGSDAVWTSRAIAQVANGAILDDTLTWTTPEVLSTNPTYISAQPPSVVCMQTSEGVNVNFDNSNGKVFAFFNDVDISETGSVVYSIISQENCTASIVTTPGVNQGKWQFNSLIGDKGSITVNAHFDGRDWPISISIVALKSGYSLDLTPPPQAATPTLIGGFSFIFIELPEVPTYTQGHGHSHTTVYLNKWDRELEAFGYEWYPADTFLGRFAYVTVPVDEVFRVRLSYTTADGVEGAQSEDVSASSGIDISGVLRTLNLYLAEEEFYVEGNPVPYPAGIYANNAFLMNLQVTNAIIADAAVDSAKIAEASINTAHINYGQITEALIEDAAISHAKIQDAAVESANIAEAAITSLHVSEAAILTAHIAEAQIDNARIADLAVSTIKIEGNAVTVPVGASGEGPTLNTPSVDTAGSPRIVIATAVGYNPDGVFTRLRVFRDSEPLYDVVNSTPLSAYSTHALVFIDEPGEGYHYYAVGLEAVDEGSIVSLAVGITVLGCKR
jgi:hypothetical protein